MRPVRQISMTIFISIQKSFRNMPLTTMSVNTPETGDEWSSSHNVIIEVILWLEEVTVYRGSRSDVSVFRNPSKPEFCLKSWIFFSILTSYAASFCQHIHRCAIIFEVILQHCLDTFCFALLLC